MIGRTIEQYQILAKIGTGGMGEVYKAFDTKLKRPVAIKRMRPETSGDPRFLDLGIPGRRGIRELHGAL